MHRPLHRLQRVLAFVPLVAASWALGSTAASADEFSTLAGTGAPGIADGPGAQASFLLPDGVVVGRDGTVYVSDYSAQNIRAIDKHGVVRTIAGTGSFIDGGLAIRGGYKDGPARTAEFNGPAGLAIDKAGRIYVADMFNKCIRVIENGMVSTLVGGPTKMASDGPIGVAGFFEPRAVAVDDSGVVWVGDGAVGLRRIVPNGAVTTVVLPKTPVEEPEFNSHITGIAISGPRLMLSDGVSLMDYNTTNPADYQYTVPDFAGAPVPEHAYWGSNHAPAGFAFGVAHVDNDIFVYTDPILHAIRVHRNALNAPISERTSENDDFLGGGFRNGNGTDAQVDAPLGIAVDGNRIVFADSGNRRIRVISNVEMRHFAESPADPFGEFADGSKYYRIMIIGNSMMANSVPFADTAGARLEGLLNAHRAELGIPRPVKVALVWLGAVDEVQNYVNEVAPSSLADMVLYDFNVTYANRVVPNADQYASPMGTVGIWQNQLTPKIALMAKTLHDSDIPFFAALQPTVEDFPPIEETASRLMFPSTAVDPQKVAGDEQLFRTLFQPAGKRLIDMWPAFEANEKSPNRRPLFASRDHHLSSFGQALVGDTFYRFLAADRPWAASAAK